MSAPSRNPFFSSLRLYAEIARFRRGPEDLPTSASLLVTTVIASFMVSLGFSMLLSQGSPRMVGPQVVDVILTLLWLVVLLRLAGKPERFLQTATAIFGFHLILAPLVAVIEALLGAYGQDPSWLVPSRLLVLGLLGWALAVTVRILASATAWPVFLCISVVLLLELVEWTVLLVMFPELMGAALAPAPATA